jgi:type IV secretory pathway VirB4 component
MNIGTDYINGRSVTIDLTKHTNIEGGSGMGKSTLIANLFIENVRNGGGGILIDPHGDVADLVKTMIPKSRLWDFIWLDPDAKQSIPLNPFNFKTPEELELAKESFFTILKAMAGSAWGDESARVIINAIDAVCAHFKQPSPVHVFRFLADDQFRKKVLAETENPLLKMFREQYDEKLPDRDQMAKFSPPINKVGKLMRPAILPIIGQAKSLDFLDIMNKRRVVVCRLSKGRLGEEIAQILGSLIVSMISIAALRREKQKDRQPFLLVVDETHNFVHGGRFSSLLAEGRKYGVSVVSATQGMYQLPFARDLLANCGNQIILNASGEDAELMAKNWGQDIAMNITDLPKYHFYLRSFKDNRPIIQMVQAAPPVRRRGDEARPTKLIKHSLERWGTDRKNAEKKIMKFLAA